MNAMASECRPTGRRTRAGERRLVRAFPIFNSPRSKIAAGLRLRVRSGYWHPAQFCEVSIKVSQTGYHYEKFRVTAKAETLEQRQDVSLHVYRRKPDPQP